MGSSQERQNLLLFASGHNIKIKFLDIAGDDFREETVLWGNDKIFPEMFVDKILLSLKYIHKLFEFLYLHGLVDPFKFNKLQYLFVYNFEYKRYDAEHPINQYYNFLLLLYWQFLTACLDDCFEEFTDEREATGQQGAVHIRVVYEHLWAEEYVHLLH